MLKILEIPATYLAAVMLNPCINKAVHTNEVDWLNNVIRLNEAVVPYEIIRLIQAAHIKYLQ